MPAESEVTASVILELIRKTIVEQAYIAMQHGLKRKDILKAVHEGMEQAELCRAAD
jgi:hypothetical protein